MCNETKLSIIQLKRIFLNNVIAHQLKEVQELFKNVLKYTIRDSIIICLNTYLIEIRYINMLKVITFVHLNNYNYLQLKCIHFNIIT